MSDCLVVDLIGQRSRDIIGAGLSVSRDVIGCEDLCLQLPAPYKRLIDNINKTGKRQTIFTNNRPTDFSLTKDG